MQAKTIQLAGTSSQTVFKIHEGKVKILKVNSTNETLPSTLCIWRFRVDVVIHEEVNITLTASINYDINETRVIARRIKFHFHSKKAHV